jgi:hypothetical protein
MQVETCPNCENPISVEMGTGFLCCMECKRRLLGFSWWSPGGRPSSLPLFKNAADADAAATRAGAEYELSAIWADVPD